MKVRKSRKTRRSGFSLLELLAVVTILGIIAVVVIPRVSVSSDTAKQAADKQNKAEINSAIERWYFEKGSYPTMADLNGTDGKAYFPEGVPKSPLTGNNYVLDSNTNRVK